MRAVEGCHPDLHGLIYSNVLLTGTSIHNVDTHTPNSQAASLSTLSAVLKHSNYATLDLFA